MTSQQLLAETIVHDMRGVTHDRKDRSAGEKENNPAKLFNTEGEPCASREGHCRKEAAVGHGGIALAATEVRRLKIQIYRDILLAIHAANRTGDPVNFYHIERKAGLPYSRLKPLLTEMEAIGLVARGFVVTSKGYRFLEDVSNKVAPVLRQYGLWQ